MITTILLLIILSISLFLITFRVYSISILLGAIAIFIIGSFILFQHNHLLIGSIFLVVYSGAILVFICISLLLSPAIRPHENYEINNQTLTIKGFRIFFLFFCFLFFLVFLIFYLTNYNPDINLIEFNFNEIYDNNFNIKIINKNTIPFYFNNIENLSNNNFNINNIEFYEFYQKNLNINHEFITILNPITTTFDITSFNLNNVISINFKDDFILIIMIGIYLLLTLLCCLVLFSINHEKRVIKRQDSVDQVLKRWI